MHATILCRLLATALALAPLAAAAEGDPVRGEREFGKCMPCHSISDGTTVLRKGGRTGPDLFGIIGSPAASRDFPYADGLRAAAESGLIWDEASLAAFVEDPTEFLRGVTGQGHVRTKMTFKMRSGADVAAYLASLDTAD